MPALNIGSWSTNNLIVDESLNVHMHTVCEGRHAATQSELTYYDNTKNTMTSVRALSQNDHARWLVLSHAYSHAYSDNYSDKIKLVHTILGVWHVNRTPNSAYLACLFTNSHTILLLQYCNLQDSEKQVREYWKDTEEYLTDQGPEKKRPVGDWAVKDEPHVGDFTALTGMSITFSISYLGLLQDSFKATVRLVQVCKCDRLVCRVSLQFSWRSAASPFLPPPLCNSSDDVISISNVQVLHNSWNSNSNG